MLVQPECSVRRRVDGDDGVIDQPVEARVIVERVHMCDQGADRGQLADEHVNVRSIEDGRHVVHVENVDLHVQPAGTRLRLAAVGCLKDVVQRRAELAIERLDQTKGEKVVLLRVFQLEGLQNGIGRVLFEELVLLDGVWAVVGVDGHVDRDEIVEGDVLEHVDGQRRLGELGRVIVAIVDGNEQIVEEDLSRVHAEDFERDLTLRARAHAAMAEIITIEQLLRGHAARVRIDEKEVVEVLLAVDETVDARARVRLAAVGGERVDRRADGQIFDDVDGLLGQCADGAGGEQVDESDDEREHRVNYVTESKRTNPVDIISCTRLFVREQKQSVIAGTERKRFPH